MNTPTANTETDTLPPSTSRGRRILRRTGLGCLSTIGLMIACAVFGMVYEAIMAPADVARYPPPGQRVDIGGYSLHNIAFDDPGAVITAVQDVIQAAQSGQHLVSR
jgi:hypothetical protein